MDASRLHLMPLRLRLTVNLSLESPKLSGVYRPEANHRFSFPSKAHQKQGSFPPPALPGITSNMTLSDSRLNQHTIVLLRVATPHSGRVSHIAQDTFLTCCPHYPGRSKQVHDGCFPILYQPSPNIGRVGIHDCPFGACSRFTRVTACQVAAALMAYICPQSFSRKVSLSYCLGSYRNEPTISRAGLSPAGDLRPRGAPICSGYPIYNRSKTSCILAGQY